MEPEARETVHCQCQSLELATGLEHASNLAPEEKAESVLKFDSELKLTPVRSLVSQTAELA